MALVSRCRNVSRSGWPARTATGKSPLGTSGVGSAGTDTGTGELDGALAPSSAYQEPPVTCTLAAAAGAASSATSSNDSAGTANQRERLGLKTAGSLPTRARDGLSAPAAGRRRRRLPRLAPRRRRRHRLRGRAREGACPLSKGSDLPGGP